MCQFHSKPSSYVKLLFFCKGRLKSCAGIEQQGKALDRHQGLT